MYISDATHFLDDKGAIGPKSGPALAMATFLGNTIAAATAPAMAAQVHCIKCPGAVTATVGASDAIEWKCAAACGTAGRITHWRGTLWDLTTVQAPQPC